MWNKVGDVGEKRVFGVGEKDYLTQYAALQDAGWRVHLLEPYVLGGVVKYSAVFRKAPKVQEQQALSLAPKAYAAKNEAMRKDGWHLHVLEPRVVGKALAYTAVWRKGKVDQQELYDASVKAYRAKDADLRAKGWRLFRLESYTQAGELRHAAIWQQGGPAEKTIEGLTHAELREQDAALRKAGWALAIVDGY